MFKVLPATIPMATPLAIAATTASPSERNATSLKLRSCVVCRTRKVRCNRESPCSNCLRANIACVFPPTERPPRWARRLENIARNAASKAQASLDLDPAAAQVMERLRNLESLVKELSGQLEQANTAASSPACDSLAVTSPISSTRDRGLYNERDANADNIQKPFGRLVLQDANRSRYVSSGFWSRINDELDGLKMDSNYLGTDDSDTSEDEASPGKTPSTQELGRSPSERHAFLFRHNLSPSGPDLREFRPLPSQIPFLLDVFSDNVNSIIRTVHMPTIAKMVRNLRSNDMASLTLANEALMFSIYYAAITSMEEDDVMTNFGSSKTDLNLKYRLGLEYALAKADFLNVPDLVLVQAFVIFLCLVRRHDSPRFVWMMTGLVIRMGQALGLHRDGTHFEHLTPYEIEMRRRVWWALCMVDVRASEDQGTDYTIARGSFDTKLPLDINDEDLEPETTQMPVEREGITDMTLTLVSIAITDVTKQMMAQSAMEGAPGIEEQSRLLNEIYQKLDRGYLQYSVESGNIVYWVGVIIARLVMAKMTLFIYLPILFSSQGEQFSDRIKTKLLVAAIETAEYNHALNAEHACRHWRWVYQTYTHWYAIVYLLIEISRRPWSPIVERAWTALHSQWLIPTQSSVDKNLRVWVPLRKLMSKAKKHRDAELKRLRNDPQAAKWLEIEDQKSPNPASPGPFPAGSNALELFRERWRQLLAVPKGPEHDTQTPRKSALGAISSSEVSTSTTQPILGSISTCNVSSLGSNTTFEPAFLGAHGAHELQTSQNPPDNTSPRPRSAMAMNPSGDFSIEQTAGPIHEVAPAIPTLWSLGPGFVPWLWADTDSSVDIFANVGVNAIDVDMNMDAEVDWYNWVESAKGMELDAGPSGNGLG